MLLLALLACDSPISNELFEADEAFLAALPRASRTGLPGRLRALPEGGDEPVLEAARAATARLEPLVTTMTHLGEVLRNTPPDGRSPTHRTFDARPVSLPDGPDPFQLRADLVRVDEDSELTWTLEAAPSAEGPWSVLARGLHTPDGNGAFTWDAPVLADLRGHEAVYDVATVSYEDPGRADQRVVRIDFPVGLDLPESYALHGEQGLSFVASLDLDGLAPLPSLVTVGLLDEGRGRAEGVQLEGETERAFTTCWNAAGDRVYASGEGLASEGQADACPW